MNKTDKLISMLGFDRYCVVYYRHDEAKAFQKIPAPIPYWIVKGWVNSESENIMISNPMSKEQIKDLID